MGEDHVVLGSNGVGGIHSENASFGVLVNTGVGDGWVQRLDGRMNCEAEWVDAFQVYASHTGIPSSAVLSTQKRIS